MQKDLTFFLIDDDEDEHELFQIALEELDPDIRCVASSNCEEALEQLKKKTIHPDFIFLDLNMPIKSGRECLCELKGHSELKSIPVVVFSTSSDPKDIADSKRLGAVEFITKPSKISELCSLISHFIQSHSNQQPAS